MIKIKTLNNKYKIITYIVAILYIIEYCYVYENFVFFYFDYANLHFQQLNTISYIVLITQALLPLYYYKGLINVASAFSIFIYIFVYIPYIVALQVAEIPYSDQLLYGVLLIFIMIFYFRTDNMYYTIKANSSKKQISFSRFELLTLLLIIVVVIVNKSSMRMVNVFTEADVMYEQRLETSSGMQSWVAYLISWITHAFLPVGLVYNYLLEKKYKVAGYVGCFVLMFMIDMNKITLLIPFAMIIFLHFGINSKFIESNFYSVVALFVAAASFVSYLFCNLIFPLTQLLILRTQCIAGEQFDRYHHFFLQQDNPFTYYMHISFLRKYSGLYPYHLSIGEMVAGGEVGSNANANFLLMDGMAAMGFIGLIIVSVLFVIMKTYMNSICYSKKLIPVIAVFLFSIMSMLNTSLFTSLISFGLIPIYLIFKYVKMKEFNI